ncbi:hypothetical protein GCM10027168_67580 [Streptomyces capparidis]
MTTTHGGPVQQDYRARLVDALRTIERLQDRLKKAKAADGAPRLDEPIAIVGLGCRLPGGADSPEAFWRLLSEGVDATSEFPADRGDASALYDPDPDAPGKTYVTRGGFLGGPVDTFEPSVFGISPREALGMDPQQRIALEVAWEALERAGYAPDRLNGSATGVYLGLSTTDYVRMRQSEGDIRDVDAYQLVGEPSFAAGRISYTLGLQGPCKVIDTTCSSSLVALHEACQALRLGDCDMALAGGVNLMLSPYGFVMMSKFAGVSPDGRCKTFDASADGYGRGEGAGIVVLKRWSDARRDGDNVIALVRGTAINHDGRSSGLTVPNPAAQQSVIRAALEQAGIAPGDVDYVEAHGTGTALGDPIELRALQAVIGKERPEDSPLLVGSVKTNIGHLESAAGVAGLLKLVLALQHGEIPPHLHFTTPNPNVDWSRLRIQVADTARPWPEAGRPRIGAISSFGASGTNAHAVVSAPPREREEAGRTGPEAPGVYLLSANSEEALTELARRHALHLRREPGLTLADACWTTQVGRARQTWGLAASAGSLEALADALDAHARGERDPHLATAKLPVHKYRKTAWLFTGQGAQYAGMAAGLADEPAFRAAFDACAELFDQHLDRPLASVVWPGPGETSPVDDTRYTQPALFAVEYALARMWQSYGLKPTALLGHSIGEIAAACVAGVFSLEDAVRLVAARASLMAALPAGGAMAAVHCDEATALAAIAAYPDTVALAAVNGPHTVTVSGAAADVDAVTAALREQGVRSQRLTVSHAFHSPLLRPMLDAFREVAGTVTYSAPAIPLYSNVTGRRWTEAEVGPEYWVRHAAGAVRFHDGITGLHADGVRTFLEVGPHPVLVGLGNRAVEDPDCVWIPSLRRPTRGVALADREVVGQALGLLHLRGGTVDWDAVHRDRPGPRRRVALPTAVWRGESYWFTPKRDSGQAAAPALPAGEEVPSVGVRLRSAVPTYQVDLDDPRWDPYARVAADGHSYLPVGAVASMMHDIVADALGGHWDCVEEVVIEQRLPRGDGRIAQFTVRPDKDGHAAYDCYSISPAEEAAGAPWTRHGHGLLRRRASGRRLARSLQVHRYGDAVSFEPAALSSALAGAVTGAHRGGGGVLVALSQDRSDSALSWVEVVDAAVAALSWDAGADTHEVGFTRRISDLICPDPRRVAYVRATAHHATGTSAKLREVSGSVEFFAEDGAHVGGIGELLVVGAEAVPPRGAPWRHPDELLQRVEWQPAQPAPAPGRLAGESWLLLPDRRGVAERLAGALRELGAHCLVAEPDEVGPDAERMAALVGRWREQAGPGDTPGRVVLLSGLDAPEPDGVDVDALVDYRDRTELTLVAAVQALLARGDGAATVSFVTRGTVPAPGAPGVTSPFGNTLWGLGRVVALEHPEHWGGAVDLDPRRENDDAAALAAALLDVRAEDQQALRDGTRYVARLVPHHLEAAELRRTPPVRQDASYLITGAFGGIGRALSRWLAVNGAGKLVLLGRTPLPPRADWNLPQLPPAVRERVALVRELEATGAAVEVVAADVCDIQQMLPVMENLAMDPRPLAGVVHAAGLSVPQFLRDIPASRPDEYDAVWRPKVVGGWLLHQLTEGADLDFFLGFSSIAATWGSQHLSSYSAANAFLDGLAEYRHSLGQAALTVSWGPWELESNLFGEDVLAFLTSTGLRTLSAPQCLKLLGALLTGRHPQAVVCAADWATYKPVMEARIERPLLRTLVVAEDFGDETDSPVLRELQGASGPEERAGRLVGYLRGVLGEVLSVAADTIEPAADVMSHGLDSLMVMEVVKRCKKDLRVSVRPNQLFERSTLEDWAELLASELGGGKDAEAGADAEDAPMSVPANIAGDVTLDPAIRPEGPLRDGYTDPRHVLLTGATGFLGAYLLDELLATTEATVHCLVRCSGPEEGLARIRENYLKYLPWRQGAEHRIAVHPGDLEKPLLGLTEELFDDLAHRLDAIYHNGAWVNFSYTYEQLRPANLTSCEEILRLACRGPLTPVSHVSTYGIWGLPADGRTVIKETDDIAGAGKLVTGYVQTKWAAERLMETARDRGIPVDVYRPGRVLGDSRTGAALTTHFTTRVIKGCVQLGIAPDLDLEIEMTPVDYVTGALVRISREPHAFGETYHLVNRRKLTFRRLVDAIAAYGWKADLVPVDDWWRALQDTYGERDNELHPVMGVVEEFVVGGEEAIDYDATNAERALTGSGINCPPLDEKLLGVYFDWMVKSGYLPAPGD